MKNVFLLDGLRGCWKICSKFKERTTIHPASSEESLESWSGYLPLETSAGRWPRTRVPGLFTGFYRVFFSFFFFETFGGVFCFHKSSPPETQDQMRPGHPLFFLPKWSSSRPINSLGIESVVKKKRREKYGKKKKKKERNPISLFSVVEALR